MELNRAELETLAAGLDVMVRNEGNALAQGGVAAIKSGRAALLANRLILAASLYERIGAEVQAIAEAEKPDGGVT